MILYFAALVELRLMTDERTDRQTDQPMDTRPQYRAYRASISPRGKIQVTEGKQRVIARFLAGGGLVICNYCPQCHSLLWLTICACDCVQLYNLFTDMMTHLDPRKQHTPSPSDSGVHENHSVCNGLYSMLIYCFNEFRCISRNNPGVIVQEHLKHPLYTKYERNSCSSTYVSSPNIVRKFVDLPDLDL